MRRNKGLTLIACMVFGFLFIPLVLISITAFGTSDIVELPIHGFTLKWFANVFKSPTFMNAFFFSLKLAVSATVLALLTGIPAAYALARFSIKGKSLMKSFFLSPTIIPGSVVGYSLYQFLIVKMGMANFGSLLLGHYLISIPYCIRIVGSSLEQFDYSVEEVAWSLGCNKVRTVMTIVLPNVTSGISSAFLLSFIGSFNNLPVSMFLTGPGSQTLPTALMNYIEYYYDPTVSAVSVLLMLLTILLMFIVEKTLGIAALQS